MIINPLSQYWTLISFQLKFYESIDYAVHEFKPNLESITNHCIIDQLNDRDKLTVYDCTDNNNNNNNKQKQKQKELTIGIASFHHYHRNNDELTRYEKLILSNHIGYTIQHKYIYFDINDLIFDNDKIKRYFDLTIPSANAIYKAQKPFIIHAILNDKYYGNKIDYVLWIDFDAIFFNCSTSIQSVIEYTNNLYSYSSDYNTMDVIFSRDYFSMSNSGVIIYKNSEWVKQLLLKQMYIFENSDKFQFSNIYKNIRSLVDQNIFNAFIMGFDPPLNDTKYLLNGTGYIELSNILKYELKIHDKIPKWFNFAKCLDDEEQYIQIHDNYIHSNIRNYSAIIPQFYINVLMGEWIYSNYYQTNKLKYDPIIVHFASSIGKPWLNSPKFKNLKCSVHHF